MLYPSELQPLIKRLLHFYYNAPPDSSFGLSIKFSNSMNSNEKDKHRANALRRGTKVS
jgi:hypothetical protein